MSINADKKILVFILTALLFMWSLSIFNIADAAGPTREQLSSFILSFYQIETGALSDAQLQTITRTILKDNYGYTDERIDGIFVGNGFLPAPTRSPAVPLGPSQPSELVDGDFVPLAEIPGVTDQSTAQDTSRFFSGAFRLGITIAGFLAVIMIAVGGLQYMSTDTIYGKSEGRERITYAILGLLLILFSWILLATINPDIVSLRLFN